MFGALEIASLALAVFPLVVGMLERTQDGCEILKDWRSFQREFSLLQNQLKLEQLLFRQHLEGLPRSITDSEFNLKRMMDDPECDDWSSPDMNSRLKHKLSGNDELDTYLSSVKSIYESLGYMEKRLRRCQPAAGATDISNSFQKLRLSIRKRRWQDKVKDLGRQIERVSKLVENTETLAPARQSRCSMIPHVLEQLKNQARSLHEAIINSWTCDCRHDHSFKLVLDKGPLPNREKALQELQIWFPMRQRVWTRPQTPLIDDDEWCTTKARMVPAASDIDPMLLNAEHTDTTSSEGGGLNLTATSSHTRTRGSTQGSHSSVPLIKISSLDEGQPLGSIPNEPSLISDLCERLQKKRADTYLGYISDSRGSNHVLRVSNKSSVSSMGFDRIVSLSAILNREVKTIIEGTESPVDIPRSARMTLALTLARTILELYPSPWLPIHWTKHDIYFFQRKDGEVVIESPFLLCEVSFSRTSSDSKFYSGHQIPKDNLDHSPAIQSLGITILELWFGRSIESNSFWEGYHGPNGQMHEYASFNAAADWQKRAQEEGGLILHNVTYRCIYINFGVTSRDLGDRKLVQAVYDGVIKELEGLAATFSRGV